MHTRYKSRENQTEWQRERARARRKVAGQKPIGARSLRNQSQAGQINQKPFRCYCRCRHFAPLQMCMPQLMPYHCQDPHPPSSYKLTTLAQRNNKCLIDEITEAISDRITEYEHSTWTYIHWRMVLNGQIVCARAVQHDQHMALSRSGARWIKHTLRQSTAASSSQQRWRGDGGDGSSSIGGDGNRVKHSPSTFSNHTHTHTQRLHMFYMHVDMQRANERTSELDRER